MIKKYTDISEDLLIGTSASRTHPGLLLEGLLEMSHFLKKSGTTDGLGKAFMLKKRGFGWRRMV